MYIVVNVCTLSVGAAPFVKHVFCEEEFVCLNKLQKNEYEIHAQQLIDD
jgi:hypothetical protein